MEEANQATNRNKVFNIVNKTYQNLILYILRNTVFYKDQAVSDSLTLT